MKKLIVASVVAVSVAAASAWADTIVQWTFENTANTNGISLAPGAGNSSGSVAADVGTGSASGLHAAAATYSTPAGDVDLTLAPTVNPSAHSFSANQWSVGDYWQFQTSTLGFTGVTVAWDQTGSNTGPADFQLSYSLDGSSFTPIGSGYVLSFYSWNTTSALGNSESGNPAGAVDNQATVYFRITDTSTTSVAAGTVATAGTDRVDDFTVLGVPEPSTVALVVSGLIGLLALRRRRS